MKFYQVQRYLATNKNVQSLRLGNIHKFLFLFPYRSDVQLSLLLPFILKLRVFKTSFVILSKQILYNRSVHIEVSVVFFSITSMSLALYMNDFPMSLYILIVRQCFQLVSKGKKIFVFLYKGFAEESSISFIRRQVLCTSIVWSTEEYVN